MSHPQIIQSLTTYFSRLPGIGSKTASRFVFYLLKQSKEDLENLSLTIKNLKEKIRFCSNCFNLCENEKEVSSTDRALSSDTFKVPISGAIPTAGLCSICRDPKRNQNIICVVAEVQDLEVLEKTSQYQGIYHILGGTLNSLEGITPGKIRIKELIIKIKKSPSQIQEIILALNPDFEGETTALYLIKLLKPYKIRLTRLARGLPMGSDLQYADEITLSNALKERKRII